MQNIVVNLQFHIPQLLTQIFIIWMIVDNFDNLRQSIAMSVCHFAFIGNLKLISQRITFSCNKLIT